MIASSIVTYWTERYIFLNRNTEIAVYWSEWHKFFYLFAKYTCFVIIFLWLSTFGGICIFLLEKVTNEARPLSYKLQNLTNKDQEGMKTHRLWKALSEILTDCRWWCQLEVDSFESREVKGSFYRTSQLTRMLLLLASFTRTKPISSCIFPFSEYVLPRILFRLRNFNQSGRGVGWGASLTYYSILQ